MKFNPFSSRDVRQIKRFILVIGVTSLLLLELSKLLFLRQSFWPVLFDTGFGLLLLFGLTELTVYFARQAQTQVDQAAEQRALVQNQLRLFGSALEAAANAIVITDHKGKILWVNSAFVTLTGYEAAEVTGKNPGILRSGQHSGEFYQQMWKTILSGQPWQGEVINRRKDGRLYTEEQTITPVRDPAGNVSHFIAIKLDITRRKQAEADLRQFAERLEAMHAIDQAILSRRALEEMIQVALQRLRQVVPWTCACIVLFDTHTDETAVITLHSDGKAMVESDTPYHLNNELALSFARNNEVYYIPDLAQSESASSQTELLAAGIQACLHIPLMVHAEELLGLMILGADVAHAFTDEHLAMAREISDSLAIAILQNSLYDAERRQREKAEVLQEIGAALSSTLNFNEVLALVVDHISRVVPSDAANIILIQGNHAHVVHSTGYEKYGPQVAAKVATLSFELSNTPNLTHILQTKQPLIIADVQNYPGWLHDKGVSSTRSWVGVPVFVQGEITAVFALSKRQPHYYHEKHIDMLQAFAAQVSLALENARLYEKLRAHAAELEDRVAERTYELAEANKRLTELDRLKSKFISDISHEMRTPITNMNVYLDLLEKGRPEKQERYRQVLKQETLRLTQLVESIFDESRQTSHLRQAQYTLVDLNQIVNDVLASYHDQITNRDLSLVCTLDPTLPAVFGEPSQLARVVTNLLTNAINYTPSGSIKVKTFHNADSIHLQVEDTGVGIDQEDMPHLFDRFYRGRNVSQSTIPGTGLGLGVVQEIVGLHHGEVSAQNRAAGGSLFEVRLPVRMPLSNR